MSCQSSPCKSSLEGAKRKLARPVRPKEPLSVDTVQAIDDFYVSSNSLVTLRFLFILLVGFYGFFRIDEINSFCLRDVKGEGKGEKIRCNECKNIVAVLCRLLQRKQQRLRARFTQSHASSTKRDLRLNLKLKNNSYRTF